MEFETYRKMELENLRKIRTRPNRLKAINSKMLEHLINQENNLLSMDEYKIVRSLIGESFCNALDGLNHQFFRTVHPLEICTEYFLLVDARADTFVSHITDLSYDAELGMIYNNILENV